MEPLIFGALSTEFFLKKPAMDVWFFELDVDFLSEGGGAAGVLFEDWEDPTILFGKTSNSQGTIVNFCAQGIDMSESSREVGNVR